MSGFSIAEKIQQTHYRKQFLYDWLVKPVVI